MSEVGLSYELTPTKDKTILEIDTLLVQDGVGQAPKRVI